MHPSTPLDRTYSAVSSSPSSSSYETRCGDQELGSAFKARSSKLGPRTIHRHSFIIRLIIFVLLEFGFLALVSAALHKPIILHLSFTIIEIKGAVTAIAIFWHALAVFVVKDILLNIFSAEWIKQDDGSSSLTQAVQELDIVSRLTTGFVDQAKHFVSKRTTASFRLGFLSLLLLMLLNGLGPSALGSNLVPYNYPTNISVANLTAAVTRASIFSSEASTIAHYASSIVQVETMGNLTTVGYHVTQPNVLIPWPSSGAVPANTTMTYESDVIRYNFICSWIIPSVSNFTAPAWKIDDQWMTYELSWGGQSVDPIILPLTSVNITSDGHFTYWFAPEATEPITYFVFFGGNATMITFLNLEDIPSLVAPCVQPKFIVNGRPAPCGPLLVSFLECNPQLEVLPATIKATGSSLQATILSGAPTVKNIPIQAARGIVSSSLRDIISEYQVATQPINAISKQLFLPDIQPNKQVKPLSPREISRNMNNILASSAKAYLGGYTPGNADFLSSSVKTAITSGIMEVQKIAMVGSKPFLVASGAIVGLLVVLLGVLVTITRPDQLESFELENIIKRLQLNYFLTSDT